MRRQSKYDRRIERPRLCQRCGTQGFFNNPIERHHITYGRDTRGSEMVAYLCGKCHKINTYLNLIGHFLFRDVFGHKPNPREWDEARMWLNSQFLKTNAKYWPFEKVGQYELFLYRKLNALKAKGILAA